MGNMAKFKFNLKEGKVYKISSFAVVRNCGNFMASEHERKLLFNVRTNVGRSHCDTNERLYEQEHC